MEILDEVFADDPQQMNDILYDWKLWRRPEQFIEEMPSEKDTLMWLCGRGWGKTRNMSSTAVDVCIHNPRARVALWGESFKTIERNNLSGDSGIIKVIHPDIEYDYNVQRQRLVFMNGRNGTAGAELQCFSADSFESSRGAQASHLLLDEICAWDYPDDAYQAAKAILRLGTELKTFIATTPKPTPLIKKLANDPDVHLVNGSTHMNHFLSPQYVKNLMKDLTDRMIRQEIYAEILDDNQYALWKRENIPHATDFQKEELQRNGYKRIIVAVDPAVTSNEKSDETGIVVVAKGYDDRFYVLEDGTMKGTPEEWGRKVVTLYHKYKADRVVAEVNNGGDLVESIIRSAGGLGFPPVKKVRASRGKEVRAEPIAALYERHEVTHVGEHPKLETQMVDWNPALDKKSPDRVDALVWGITELMKGGGFSEVSEGVGRGVIITSPYVEYC